MYTGPNNITKDGLLIYIDPSNTKSYPNGGSVAYDLMGNSNINMNGNTSLVSGSVSGSSLNVPFMNLTGTGSANYGYFSNNTIFNNVVNCSCEFVAFWGTLGTGGPDTLFSNESARFYVNATGAGNLGGLVRGSVSQVEGTFTGNGIVTTNTWYHLVFTVDFLGSFLMYRNGVLVGGTSLANVGSTWVNPTGATTGAYQPALGSRYSGYGTPGTKMTGGVGLFKFYNRAITADEINQNYNALKPRFNLS
jgi:hypothetical protein